MGRGDSRDLISFDGGRFVAARRGGRYTARLAARTNRTTTTTIAEAFSREWQKQSAALEAQLAERQKQRMRAAGKRV
jgi:hypothetical protein